MRRKQLVNIYLLVLIILLPQQLFSQDVYKWVYKIRSADNKYQKEAIIQTGFRLKGIRGIITALHGVVTGKNLSAKNETTYESFTNLKLTKVDVARDIALLTSEELLNQSDDGLDLGQIDKIKVNDKLYVLGKPLDIETIFSPVSVGNPKEKKIITMIPEKSRDAFLKRGSPGEMTNVLHIDGALVPGHSGAPLLDNYNKVLGVVNGGVIGEAHGGVLQADICWAIPINQIQWKDVNNEQKRLDQLSEINPNELFAFDTEQQQSEPFKVNISFLASDKGLKEPSINIRAEYSVLTFGFNCMYGVDIGYLIRHFQIKYNTLPGLDEVTKEENQDYIFVSLYGSIIPFDWKWFNPAVGVLLGIGYSGNPQVSSWDPQLQLLINLEVFKVNNFTIDVEWRTMFYKTETYSIDFNQYGNSITISNTENTIQSFLGLNFSLGYNLNLWQKATK